MRFTRVHTRALRYLQRPSKSEANSLCAGPPVAPANEEPHFTFHTTTEMTNMTQSKMKDETATGDRNWNGHRATIYTS